MLFSPASWGPIAVRRQLVVIQDIGPQLYPEYFKRPYRAMSTVLTPGLIGRSAGIGVSCTSVGHDLEQYYGADPAAIFLIPPGVGGAFTPAKGPLGGKRSTYCVMVGAHDRRKNASWLLEWWPRAHRELGLELVVTRREDSTARFSDRVERTEGVTFRLNPTDAELAELYRGALCLLWPSHFEGFGLPLLEAMAVGTPFLSTDTGAARDVAVHPGQVLPLVADQWIDQLRRWTEQGLGQLREASAALAAMWTWDAAGNAAADALRRVAELGR
ncbi:MAG: hypothetical protein NVS3B21_03200 [Acidimicrobiales bacterium]